MKPNPFSGLNHFTVPVGMLLPSFLAYSSKGRLKPGRRHAPLNRKCRACYQAPGGSTLLAVVPLTVSTVAGWRHRRKRGSHLGALLEAVAVMGEKQGTTMAELPKT